MEAGADSNRGVDASTEEGGNVSSTNDASIPVDASNADESADASWCVRNASDLDTIFYLMAIPYVDELIKRCELGGFTSTLTVPQLQAQEECFAILLTEQLGCPNASPFADASSPAYGVPCGAGYFVHPTLAGDFSNADLDQALIALDLGLASSSYTATDRAEIRATMNTLRARAVTTPAVGLTRSTCGAGPYDAGAGG